ncbi:hypothetical protein [Nannocystis punicea]|uniref:Uncharacterized protein n=1 Tax=Nannocystis punicea TaxID=2995304 RepID=A0ABY7GSR8_9BACT|nr:hypothetical protein [Nannocystis poenicansa]WAS89997.1 hypothetical protein O0S08_27705 [Nannocystis poenicansa]
MTLSRRLICLFVPAALLGAAAPLQAFQLDPGTKLYSVYELTFSDGIVSHSAATLSAKTAFSGYLGGKEHWSLPAGFMAAIDAASPGATLRIDGSAGSQELPSGAVPGFPVAGALAEFTMPAHLSSWMWTPVDAAPPAAFYRSSSATDNVGIAFDLSPPTGTRTHWTGSITWYVLTGSTPSGYPIAAGSDTTFTLRNAPAAARDHAWYSVTLTPTTL